MNYTNLIIYQNKIAELEYLVNILWWELKTQAPDNSVNYLSDMITKIELELFKLKTDSEYKRLLDCYLDSDEVKEHSLEINRYYQQFRKKYELNKKVPTDFFEKYNSLGGIAE